MCSSVEDEPKRTAEEETKLVAHVQLGRSSNRSKMQSVSWYKEKAAEDTELDQTTVDEAVLQPMPLDEDAHDKLKRLADSEAELERTARLLRTALATTSRNKVPTKESGVSYC